MKRLALLVTVALVLCGSTSWGQDRCVPFTGTINAGIVANPVTGEGFFVGTASFTFENGQATTTTVNTGVKKGGPGTTDKVTIGTELTTVRFDSGSLVMPTQFTAVQPVGRVNETGTIAPNPEGPGKFANVHGHFTSHGPFGFGVPLPEVEPPAGFIWIGIGWIGEYHGNICGLD